ncbi:MAG: hypothetical protein JWM57_1424 [Phycisphaerales bacterium]|nr:hypothetical protein [Phycisphaerales bacterium]
MSDPTITDAFRYSNYIEGVFWFAVGALAFKAARDRGCPRHAKWLLITFVIFGFSDWVESTTGAWWRPWWLFVWKAVCVVAVVVITVHARRRTISR